MERGQEWREAERGQFGTYYLMANEAKMRQILFDIKRGKIRPLSTPLSASFHFPQVASFALKQECFIFTSFAFNQYVPHLPSFDVKQYLPHWASFGLKQYLPHLT